MKRRFTAVMMSMILMLSGCASPAKGVNGIKYGDPGASGQPVELIWWTYSPDGTAPDHAEEVLEKANEISREKIGVMEQSNYGFSSAASLIQNGIGCLLLIFANRMIRLIDPDGGII
ncbi:MAG TPA: hypothetical protein DCW47_08070 [Lachnospiraceae bacterium]|nr:hypothetical protein [Lachnospiraceae bacterium]